MMSATLAAKSMLASITDKISGQSENETVPTQISQNNTNDTLSILILDDTRVEILKRVIEIEFKELINGKKTSLEGDIIKVNAYSLFSEYEKNEIKANSMYKGKKIILVGKIKSVSCDIFDEYYITMETGNHFQLVNAYFGSKWKDELVDLKKGETHTIVGFGAGFFLGSPCLKNCMPYQQWLQEELRKKLVDINVFLETNSNEKINEKITEIFEKRRNPFGFFAALLFVSTDKDVKAFNSELIKAQSVETEVETLLKFVEKQKKNIEKIMGTSEERERINKSTLKETLYIVKTLIDSQSKNDKTKEKGASK
jgi:hypothetical protein